MGWAKITAKRGFEQQAIKAIASGNAELQLGIMR